MVGHDLSETGLVVEKPETRVGEDNIVLVRGFDAFGVHDTATGRGEVFDPAPECTMDVVGEGEERVA